MSFESSWQFMTLQDAGISLIDCDHKTPTAQTAGFPYIAIPQLKDGHVRVDGTERRISETDFIQWTKKLLPQENDVIVVRRCNSGQSAYVPKGVKWAIGQNLVVLRSDGKKVYPPFLRWLVRSDEWWEQVRKYLNVGAVFDSLKCREIPLFELPIPPMVAQIEIATVLNSIDARIELLRETNATLEAIAQALFKSWFVDFDPVHANAGTQAPSLPPEIQALFPATFTDSPQGPIPEGWKLVPFGDLLTHTIGGDWGDELPTEKNEVRVAIIRGTDLPDLAAGNAERVPLRYTSAKKLARRKLQDGDLVLEVSGGSKDQPTGRSLYLTNGILSQFDCPMEPASFCRLLRPESQNISVVLAQHMTYIYAQGKTWEYQNQSTGISNFQTTHFLESELVIVPSDEVLKLFAENVRPMIDRAHLTQISKLTALRDTLLPRLISGQLRLPEAEQAIAAITD